MSSPSSTPIPAGWYPDPAGSFQQRWWTGQSWTNDFAQYRPTLVHAMPVSAAEIVATSSAQQQTAAAQQQTVSSASYAAQQAAATGGATAAHNGQHAAAYSPTQTLLREQTATVTPLPVERPVDPLPAFRLPDADQPPQTVVAQPNAGNAALVAVAPSYRPTTLNPDFSNDYLPFSSAPQVRRGTRVQPDRRYTLPSVLMAILPLVLVGAAYALATLLPLLYTTFTQVVFLVGFLLASVGLAAIDRRSLYNDGHDSTAAPALALLTPLAYLIARSVFVNRETGRGALAPLVVLLIVIAGIVAALVLVSGLLPLLLTASALY